MEQKTCTKCQLTKSISLFSPCKTTKDNLSSWCKSCKAEAQRLLNKKKGCSPKRLRNKEHLEQGLKECFCCNQILPLEKFSPVKRGYGGVSAYCRACINLKSKENRKELSEYVKQWRKDNVRWCIQHRNHQHKRRVYIQDNTTTFVTTEELITIYDTEICYYCSSVIPKEDRTVDHKTPISRGGPHSLENLVMACKKCNSSKGSKTEQEFKDDKD